MYVCGVCLQMQPNRGSRVDFVRMQPSFVSETEESQSDELSAHLSRAQVNMYRGQLLMDRRNGRINKDTLLSLLKVRCGVQIRYKYLPFEELLKNNQSVVSENL